MIVSKYPINRNVQSDDYHELVSGGKNNTLIDIPFFDGYNLKKLFTNI